MLKYQVAIAIGICTIICHKTHEKKENKNEALVLNIP